MTDQSADPLCRCRHALRVGHQDDVIMGGLGSKKYGKFTVAHGTCLLVNLGMHQDVGTLIHHRQHVPCMVARIVIKHDDLVLGIVLAEQHGQVACQRLRLVVAIDQHTHSGLPTTHICRCPGLPVCLASQALPYHKVQNELNEPCQNKQACHSHQPKGIIYRNIHSMSYLPKLGPIYRK